MDPGFGFGSSSKPSGGLPRPRRLVKLRKPLDGRRPYMFRSVSQMGVDPLPGDPGVEYSEQNAGHGFLFGPTGFSNKMDPGFGFGTSSKPSGSLSRPPRLAKLRKPLAGPRPNMFRSVSQMGVDPRPGDPGVEYSEQNAGRGFLFGSNDSRQSVVNDNNAVEEMRKMNIESENACSNSVNENIVLYDARANTGIDRAKVIDAVAKSVPSVHKVDLANPDISIMVQIAKTICLIGVVEKYKELAKYNLRQLSGSPSKEQ